MMGVTVMMVRALGAGGDVVAVVINIKFYVN